MGTAKGCLNLRGNNRKTFYSDHIYFALRLPIKYNGGDAGGSSNVIKSGDWPK